METSATWFNNLSDLDLCYTLGYALQTKNTIFLSGQILKMEQLEYNSSCLSGTGGDLAQ